MTQSNPLLYGLIGLLAGAAAGAGAYAILAPSKTVTEQTTVTQGEQKGMTPEELAELCKHSDLFKNTQNELVGAQTKGEGLRSESEKKGLTIVPLRWYNKKRVLKIEIAVGRGKKKHDKRQAIKEREFKRDLRKGA